MDPTPDLNDQLVHITPAKRSPNWLVSAVRTGSLVFLQIIFWLVLTGIGCVAAVVVLRVMLYWAGLAMRALGLEVSYG
jgi:hypothetical protein